MASPYDVNHRQSKETRHSRRYIVAACVAAAAVWGAVLVTDRQEQAAPTAVTALANVDELRAQSEQAERQVRSARVATARAREAVIAAEANVEKFLAAHFDELAKEETPPVAPQVASPVEEADEPAPEPVPVVNPQRMAVAHEIDQLEAKRKNLLERLTEKHPAILRLDTQVAELREKFEALPAFTATVADPAELALNIRPDRKPRPAVEPPISNPVSGHRFDSAASAAQYGQLSAELEKANQSWQIALLEERRAVEHQADVARRAVLAVAEAPTATPEAPINWVGIAMLSAVALIVAGAAALFGSELFGVFATPDHVRAALGIPVLAVLPQPSLVRGSGAAPSPQSRLLRLFGETAMAIAIFLAIAAIAQDPHRMHRLFADPIASLAALFR